MSDRELLKNVWKDLVSTMGLFAYLGDKKVMIILANAEKIRAHICEDEGLGWDKAIMDEILLEQSNDCIGIIGNAEKQANTEVFPTVNSNWGCGS